jgi:protein-S-isoprenylcysteine O-methyltransferase Ste14
MKLVRTLAVSVAIVGMSTASFAGDLMESAAKAVQQETETRPSHLDKAYAVPGAALFITGMSLAVYGFLHTSGGDFVSGQVSKESKTTLGGAGLGLAGVGGAILYLGSRHMKHAPSITVAPGAIGVAKRLSW